MKHYILVKWNELVTDKVAIIEDAKKVFSKCLKVEGIRAIEFLPNIVDKPNRYDLLIRIDMDKESLEDYIHSEGHIEWKENYTKFIQSKAIFDSND